MGKEKSIAPIKTSICKAYGKQSEEVVQKSLLGVDKHLPMAQTQQPESQIRAQHTLCSRFAIARSACTPRREHLSRYPPRGLIALRLPMVLWAA
ncbi:hypothetical protein ACS33_08660 [Edwardsiella ictaluri]|nr:hypothetical protein [Edwardsiella ictaluri]KMQ78366.1 hypothetical protein ABY58_09015 [Edwardsiella ictaluri]KOO55220.1 hypothetical protein ACS33_08660 [Edwardsiella ictaluri]